MTFLKYPQTPVKIAGVVAISSTPIQITSLNQLSIPDIFEAELKRLTDIFWSHRITIDDLKEFQKHGWFYFREQNDIGDDFYMVRTLENAKEEMILELDDTYAIGMFDIDWLTGNFNISTTTIETIKILSEKEMYDNIGEIIIDIIPIPDLVDVWIKTDKYTNLSWIDGKIKHLKVLGLECIAYKIDDPN